MAGDQGREEDESEEAARFCHVFLFCFWEGGGAFLACGGKWLDGLGEKVRISSKCQGI